MAIIKEKGEAGVYIGAGANVKIVSGDFVGGDKITVVDGVGWEFSHNVATMSPADYDEEENKFKRTVVLLGEVEVEIGQKTKLHELFGGFNGRLILGTEVKVVEGEDGSLSICGVFLPVEVLGELKDSKFRLVRQTQVNNEFIPGSRSSIETKELSKVEFVQKLMSPDGEDEKGVRKLVVGIYQCEDEDLVTYPWKELTPMSGETERKGLKLIVEIGGTRRQLKALMTRVG